MTTTIRRLCFLIVTLAIFTHSNAQDLRTFNQNSSRSNNTRGLSISFSPSYSTSVNNSSDSLLFRGSGGGLRVGADYFFGNAGIGFSSGFGSSAADNGAINNFLKNSPIPPDQLLITKSNQQNMYLLLGPSVKFGNTVQLYAHAKGGLFVNNGGLINIQQKGAQRAAYRNESTGKSLYPGFQSGLSFQYKGKSDVWSFGVGADYMSTKTEVTNYDARRGGGIEGLKLSRNISDVIAGISVRYNIFSPRDHASGQSTGRRVLPTVNKRETKPRDAASGLATGKTYQPGRPVYGNITGVEENTASCGPVVMKTTKPDGTTEEMTFSCPNDAANYASKTMGDNGGMPNRISMNVTVPKQTQGATFGEKVNAGLDHAGNKRTLAAPHVFESKGIISGTLTWATAANTGIISNAVVSNSSPRSGSTTLNSQSSSTRTTNQSSFGTMVRLSARDVSSGQATGKRSRDASSGLATGKRSRDAGSGLATGKRQYEPIFIEGQGDVCNPCLATAKMSSAKSNPLYVGKGLEGTNPMYESRTIDDDCDGVPGADIYLIDVQSNSVVAKTKTEECGDFFFANVPEGNYTVRISAAFLSKKGYDVYLKSKTDVAGTVDQSDDWMQLTVSSSTDDDGMTQKAGISTSRSNIRQKSISIIEADLDGDGEFESLRATATFSDGTSRDITTDARKGISNTAGTKGIVLSENAFSMARRAEVLKSNKQRNPGAKTISSIAVSNTSNGLRATATFSDGSSKDVTDALVANTTQNNVRQYSIMVADLDGDGLAEACMKISKSRSNIQNNRIAGDPDDDGAAEAVVKTKTKSNQSNDRVASSNSDDEIWSPRSNTKMIRVATGDVDGDGAMDLVAGNVLKSYFEKGDKPTQERSSIIGGALPGGPIVSGGQMRPGSPIGGLSIKGGKNPGGNLRTVQTNENGEFEFNDLETGDYTFTIEQQFVLDDETPVTVGNRSGAQDHNSSRSNKTASSIATDPDPQDAGAKKDRAVIIEPKNSGKILTDEQAKSNVAFRWTPLVPKPKESVTYRLRVWQLMQGQNGTQALRNEPIVEKEVINASETSVQGILTGPCKPPYLCDFIWSVQAIGSQGNMTEAGQGRFSVKPSNDDEANILKAQNNNTVRSNRTELKAIIIEADMDGDGDYESDVSDKLSDEISVDKDGNISAPQQKAGISTSRSNIRTRAGLVDKGDGVFVSHGKANINDKDVAVRMVYKSMHDMQMGAIRNLK